MTDQLPRHLIEETHDIMHTLKMSDLTCEELLAMLAAVRPAYRRVLKAHQRQARVLHLVPRNAKTRNGRTPQRV